jgi:NAD+ kinase
VTSLSETRDRATVVVVGRSDRPEARKTAQRAVDWLALHGHTVVALPQDIAVLAVDRLEARDDPFSSADLVLSIGGDGTMLRAVSLVNGRPVPVLGVNVGLLGYLAEVEPANLETSLERFFTGQYVTERRLVLEVEVRHLDGRRHVLRALNEASFEKTKSGQTIRLAVRIDDVPFTTFQADGLLVATPTGSTAYALSARGPIVSPTHQAILVTPLAPHMLFDRSLVLDSTETVDVEVVGDREVVMAVDGQEVCSLAVGDSVFCRTSVSPAIFVRLEPNRFHQVLKAKFGLADR